MNICVHVDDILAAGNTESTPLSERTALEHVAIDMAEEGSRKERDPAR